jgi:hypothetical protein
MAVDRRGKEKGVRRNGKILSGRNVIGTFVDGTNCKRGDSAWKLTEHSGLQQGPQESPS